MTMADQATTVGSLARRQLDRVVSPSTRREVWDRTLSLAAQRPGLFAFVALLTALSLPPILLFTTFVLSTLLLTLGAAVLFTLFWTGVALLLLVPSLFLAAGCAVFLWTWAVGAFIAARWLARRTGFDLGFGSSSESQGGASKLDGEGHSTGDNKVIPRYWNGGANPKSEPEVSVL